jgi:hypothetical protein
MELSLFTVGGISAFVYAGVTLFLYVYLWTRWKIIDGGEASQILTTISQKHGEWSALWWSITIIPYAMIPVFLAVLMSLWKDEPALASMAFIAGMTAFILGIIGPLRSATTTGTLSRIHATGNEMEKTSARVIYKSGESYGKGLFCLFGAT